MRIVAQILNSQVEVTGITQYIDTIKSDFPYWEKRLSWEMEQPPALNELYTPQPNTAHAFLAVIQARKERLAAQGNGNLVQILEQEDVDPMPYDEPFTGEPGKHMQMVALIDGHRVEISGATQRIAALVAPPQLYKAIRIKLFMPYTFSNCYAPEPDTALAFCSLLDKWQYSSSHEVKILKKENVDTLPSEDVIL